MLRFKILGALEVVYDHKVLTPSAPKIRQVLALMLIRANHLVHTEALIDELWGDEPPQSAVTTAQTYIYQLRKIFHGEDPASAHEGLLTTRPPGYVLRVLQDQLDANSFDRLASQGRLLLAAGRLEHAGMRLQQALNLWEGRPLANVSCGRLLEAHLTHLEEQRIRTLEMRIEVDERLGRHRELIGELRSLVTAYPLNEWFHAKLITALSHSGRRSEALQAYQQLRGLLQAELGLDPSAELQRLQQDVLASSNGGQSGLPLQSVP